MSRNPLQVRATPRLLCIFENRSQHTCVRKYFLLGQIPTRFQLSPEPFSSMCKFLPATGWCAATLSQRYLPSDFSGQNLLVSLHPTYISTELKSCFFPISIYRLLCTPFVYRVIKTLREYSHRRHKCDRCGFQKWDLQRSPKWGFPNPHPRGHHIYSWSEQAGG